MPIIQKLVLPENGGRTTIRAANEDRDRFNQYRDEEGVTQHVFFKMLLDHWEQSVRVRQAS